MDKIVDLVFGLLIILVIMWFSFALRYNSLLTEGRTWHRKYDRCWYEFPYRWFNMLARALTGYGIFLSSILIWNISGSFVCRPKVTFHLVSTLKWALIAPALDILYCIVYNIWLKFNRPGVIGLDYGWGDRVRPIQPNTSIWQRKERRRLKRKKRQLNRARSRMARYFSTGQGDSGFGTKPKPTYLNKNRNNPRYAHRH